jgi:hypothetical protein
MKAKRVEEVEVEGKKGWRYSDGSCRDARGKMLKKPEYPGMVAAEITTSEQGREMQLRRRNLSRERTREGIAEGLGIDLRTAGVGEEWKTLTSLFVQQFKSSKNLRGMSDAYGKLGLASGYMRPDAESSEAGLMLASFAKIMQAFLETQERDEVINGAVKEIHG